METYKKHTVKLNCHGYQSKISEKNRGKCTTQGSKGLGRQQKALPREKIKFFFKELVAFSERL
ncbi:MAG: hypothetical protein MJ143_06275 [Clostridia bacterium]|nr:hypothetical protein [Clostridia bacterium]